MEIDYHQKNKSRDGNKGQPTRPGPPTVSPTAPSAVLSHFDSYNFNFQNLSSKKGQTMQFSIIDKSFSSRAFPLKLFYKSV